MSDISSTVKEYTSLFVVNSKVRISNFMEYLRVVTNYYSNKSFFKIDAYLVSSYLFNNPFAISKRFLLHRGEQDIYTYGETPLTTLDMIAQECRLSAKDTVFELGCGRGRTCFWLNQLIGCSVVGIDYIPEFIHRAQEVQAKFDVKRIEFRLEDLLQSDLTGATVIYLYGTCFSDAFIHTLLERLRQLPRGTKVITVSYSLEEYVNDASFVVLKRFPARFTWGTADVYLQVKQ